MGLLNTFRHQYTSLPINLTQEQCSGKTYIVTGANIGIGLECAKHLVRLQSKRVILAVRSESRGKTALAELESETGRPGVAEVWMLDLSSFDSVKAFVNRVEVQLDRVDGLISNAAAASAEWTLNEGIESTVAVNVVGTMLLSVLMMPYLKSFAQRSGTKPVMNIVTSDLGFVRQEDLRKMDQKNIFSDISDSRKWSIDGTNRYAFSKLLQIYAIRHFATLAPVSKTGVIINYLSPGLCNTGLTRYYDDGVKVMVAVLRGVMGRSAEWGSRNLLYAVSLGEESHGKYISYCEIVEKELPPYITDASGRELGEKIWNQLVVEMERAQPGCVKKALDEN
ncbi:unnamed protein product [Clonostachys rhizophaga]|uniref:Uncharacterized protein n=1 Tax=Clonostachys rhizophaga TaxID=160324 RepID=A0A9N9VXV8_9HYPO|nr:unnamed protein product [Clonostachys rhizophaga]